MGEHRSNHNKKRKKTKKTFWRHPFVIGVLVVLAALVVIHFIGSRQVLSASSAPVAALKDYVLNDEAFARKIPADQQPYVVFISLCDGNERALVVNGTGRTLQSAWHSADRAAAALTKKMKYDVRWAKADIVNHTEEIDTVDLNREVVEGRYQNFFRKGISFDKQFKTAFLEAEVNGNKMITYYSESDVANRRIDYDANLCNLENINFYLQHYYDAPPLTAIPDRITLFTTTGAFCDESLTVYPLYDEGLDYGRRIIDPVDDQVVYDVIQSASLYLYDMIQPDGSFLYGYYPVFDNEMGSYNILRHTTSLWSLINLYRMTNDRQLVPMLDQAIAYMESYIEYQDADTAYLVERKADEIKLGGNGVAIIMLTEYMDVFETDRYVALVRKLANGIVALQDEQTGSFYHVLHYPSFERKEAYRTVYYDGEATFGLARAYAYTGEQPFLDRAALAVDYFIANDYTKHRDHWISYALNEITKYIPDERYYTFALQNVSNNLERIYQQKTSFHTYLELLTTGWQTYQRILQEGVELAYLDEFDATFFAQTLYKRAHHMLNGYFYPEYAMYMKKPDRVLGTFFVRHDNYRIRIDDIQHFIGGYYFYTLYYDQIRPYLSDAFVSSIHSESISTALLEMEEDFEE